MIIMTRIRAIALLVSVTILVVIAIFYFRPYAVSPSVDDKVIPTIELLTSDLIVVTSQALVRGLVFTGSVRALNQATVRAKVSGDIDKVYVREGMSVRQGQVLAHMNTLEAHAHAEQNIASLEIAQRNYANNKRLFDQGFISATAFESAVSNLKAAQAAVSLTRKGVNDTVIRAPIAGQIAERNIEPGEKIAADTKLFVIIDPTRLEIEAHIPAEQMSTIAVGQMVRLQIADLPMTGKVVRINPATAAGSRAVSVYIAMNEVGAVRAGMFAQGEIVLDKRDAALVIPLSAVLTHQTQTSVVRVEQGALIYQPVTLGLRSGFGRDAQVEVIEGLRAGESIVRKPSEHLPKNSKVKILSSVRRQMMDELLMCTNPSILRIDVAAVLIPKIADLGLSDRVAHQGIQQDDPVYKNTSAYFYTQLSRSIRVRGDAVHALQVMPPALAYPATLGGRVL